MNEHDKVEAEIAQVMHGQQRPGRFSPDHISPDQISLGMHLCYQNAVALLEDSRLLAINRRCARALSLTVIAIEELGKTIMLCDLLDPSRTSDQLEFWKDFTKHHAKQRDMASYGRYLEDIATNPYRGSVSSSMLDAMDRVKQSGFYVDFCGTAFQSPQEFADQTRATLDYWFAVAEERADSFAQFHSTLEQSESFARDAQSFARDAQSDPPERDELSIGLGAPSSPAMAEVALAGILLSYASQFSAKGPIPDYESFNPIPDYESFNSCVEELVRRYSAPLVGQAVLALGRLLMNRASAETKVKILRTSARRASAMIKLVLAMINQQWCPPEIHDPVAQAWATDSGASGSAVSPEPGTEE
jgi:AbiV family abortive infection protein